MTAPPAPAKSASAIRGEPVRAEQQRNVVMLRRIPDQEVDRDARVEELPCANLFEVPFRVKRDPVRSRRKREGRGSASYQTWAPPVIVGGAL